jgi:hypothetical protein
MSCAGCGRQPLAGTHHATIWLAGR